MTSFPKEHYLIKIDPEYSTLVNTLSKLEYESLKSSIKENGLHLPIVINSNYIILDGHHRYKICQELDVEPKFEVKDFKDEYEEKLFVIDSNVKRRQLNNFQRAELAYKLADIASERARFLQRPEPPPGTPSIFKRNECGGEANERIIWGGPAVKFRWDYISDVDIKFASVREIIPPKVSLRKLLEAKEISFPVGIREVAENFGLTMSTIYVKVLVGRLL